MIIPDTNLLLYAYDRASPFHTEAKRWCEHVMSGPEPLVLIPSVIFGFVRIATHPKIFEERKRIFLHRKVELVRSVVE